MTRTYFYEYHGTLQIPADDRDTADMHASAMLPEGVEFTYTGSEELGEEDDYEPKRRGE